MRLLRTWQLGIKSLTLHPMRSLLTILGIFIGVASVIWLLAIGEGISKKAQEQIEGLGAENIIIRTVKPPDEQRNDGGGPRRFGVTHDDFDLLSATLPFIKMTVRMRELPYRFQYAGNPNTKPIDGRLVGCTANYREINKLKVAAGRFLLESDEREFRNNCVIAARLADELFGSEDPLDRDIFLPEARMPFRIVGVLEHRNATAAIGGSLSAQDYSKDVYIPLATMEKRMGSMVVKRSSGNFSVQIFELSQITLQATSSEHVPELAKLVEASLNPKEEPRSDVAVVVPYELLEQAKTTRLMFMLFMGLIAAISLLVGGIGIMNIMLATVTERTREIGIRRALGAKRRDIIKQFLTETISLSVLGGLAGVIAGLFCPIVVDVGRDLLIDLFPKVAIGMPQVVREMKPTIVPISIPIAFGISVVVGVIFGIYPAIRAASMNPIEALRHAN